MIVGTVFLSILKQMKIHLILNRKENCPHDHIPFNLKGNGILVSSVQVDDKKNFSPDPQQWTLITLLGGEGGQEQLYARRPPIY